MKFKNVIVGLIVQVKKDNEDGFFNADAIGKVAQITSKDDILVKFTSGSFDPLGNGEWHVGSDNLRVYNKVTTTIKTFKIGDIVRFIGSSDEYIEYGSIGRVIDTCDNSLEAEWDFKSTREDGTNNWWALHRDLELLEVVKDKSPVKNGDLVVIKSGFKGDKVRSGVIGRIQQVHNYNSDYSWVECLLGDFEYIEPRKQDLPRAKCDLPANCYCIGNYWLNRLKPVVFNNLTAKGK